MSGKKSHEDAPIMKYPKKIIKTFEELPSTWRQDMMDRASEGISFTRIHTAMGLTRFYHERMLANHVEYREWWDLCHDIAYDEWIRIGRDLIYDRNASASTYAFMMQNMFKWTRQDAPQKPEKEKEDDNLNADAEVSKYKKESKSVKAEITQ